MRATVTLLLLVLALGAAAWLLRTGPASPVPEPTTEPSDDAPEDPEAAPRLIGVSEERLRTPPAVRGLGTLQGVVRRGGEPVPAAVELRHVAALDGTGAFGSGARMQMIERMLDAGVSSTAVIARARAGADGAYRFSGLASGLYEVRARAEDGATGFVSARLPAAGARVEASIDIPGGRLALQGRVLYANDRPFRGLVVAATGEGFAGLMGGAGTIQPTTTDQEGRFRVGGLSPGSVRISALIPGVLRVMGPPVRLPHEGEYVLTIGAAGIEVTGRVVTAGGQHPIPGASVLAGGGDPSSAFAIRATTSDAEGRFTVLIPAGVEGGLFVRARGYAMQTVPLRGELPDDLVVPLIALGRVSGRVVSKPDGAPVEGVTVLAARERRRGGPDGSASARTDAQGRYALVEVPPGPVRVMAIGAGWISEGFGATRDDAYSPYVLNLDPGASAELDLEVDRAGSASGRVTTAGGEAVPGCVVQTKADGPSMAYRALLGATAAPLGSAVTDAEGRYVLPTLVPGRETALTAHAPGHPEATSEPFTPLAGKPQAIDIQLQAARWLQLRVVSAAGGAPVAGAQVHLVPPEEGDQGIRIDELAGAPGWTTDAQGRARVGPLSRGTRTIGVTAAGHAATAAAVGPDDPSPTLTVELPPGLIIAGRVVFPEGVPMHGVRVRVETDMNYPPRGEDRSWINLRPALDAAGAFRVDTLSHPGRYEVSARSRWEGRTYAARVVVPAGTEDVELELKLIEPAESGSKLSVRVLGADGGPVATGRVKLYQFKGSGGSSSNRRDLRNGATAFTSVHADRECWIEIWETLGSQGGATIHGPLETTSGQLEIRLAKSATIRGEVVGPDGRGVPGVRVTARALHPSAHRRTAEEHALAATDAQGRYELKGLGPLDYELRASVPPAFAPVAPLEARAGATGVRFELRGGVSATLTVVDAAGEPLAGADVSVQSEAPAGAGQPRPPSLAPARMNATSNSAGVVTLRGLDPEAVHTLSVTRPNDRSDVRSVRREGWRPQDETIVLEPAYAIRGVVRDTEGESVVGCRIQVRAAGSGSWGRSERTDEEGRFTFEMLAAGVYDLKADPPGGGRRAADAPTATNVRAGGSEVVLTLDLGARLTVRVRDYQPPSSPPGAGPGPSLVQAHLRSQTVPPTVLSGALDESGRVAFRGLKVGTAYALWIGGLAGGRYVSVPDLRPGSDEVVVDAQQGGRIEGRVTLPSGVKAPQWITLHAHNERLMQVSGRADPQTLRFVLDGLPEDDWTVRASAWGEGKRYNGKARVRTGGEVVIELTAGE